MLPHLKHFARAVAPPPVKTAWGRVYGDIKIRRARRAFAEHLPATSGQPSYLPAEMLPALMRCGYRPPDVIRYDPAGLTQRAAEKVARIERVVGIERVEQALELGCWDGMVAATLADRGIQAFGLDIATRGFDARAREAGVRFLQCTAESIALADESVDLVYSFASFEHFPHPDRCLAEIGRILRPHGHAYLEFGPLYFSPYGRHAYRQIPIPFCHLLFEEQVLHQWAEAQGMAHDWPFVNGWRLARYRALWKAISSDVTVVSYHEYSTGGVGTELIARYPLCFRDRVEDFDEFLVTHVEIVLRKR